MKLIVFAEDIALVAKIEQNFKTIQSTLVEEGNKTRLMIKNVKIKYIISS